MSSLLCLFIFGQISCRSKGKIQITIPNSSVTSIFKDPSNAVSPLEIDEDPIAAVSFQIPVSSGTFSGSSETGDTENLNCSDLIGVTSDNLDIIDVKNIFITMVDGICQVSFSVNENASGSVVLRVINLNNPSDYVEIPVVINPVNDAPNIVSSPPTLSTEDSTGEISMIVNDDSGNLPCVDSIRVISDNQPLISDANISVTGVYPECLITYTPEANQTGTAQISVDVFDGEFTSSMVYTVSVLAADDPASLSNVVDQTCFEDSSINNLAVNISDIDSTHSCSSIVPYSSSPEVISTQNIVFSGVYPNCFMSLTPNTNAVGTSLIRIDLVTNGSIQATEEFNILVTAVNDPPTDLALSSLTVAENAGPNVAVGTLSATDVDSGEIYTYSLVAGLGDTENALVNISGNQLRLNASADFETKPSYNVRIRATDPGGLFFEKSFSISISDGDEPPTLDPIADQLTSEDAAPISISLSASDPDSQLSCSGNHFSYTSSNQNLLAQQGGMSFSGTWPNCIASIQPVPDTFGVSNITVIASDGVLLASQTFALNVTAVNDAPQFSAITDQNMLEDAGSKVINFSLSDIDSSVTCASVNISSSQTSLIDSSQMSLAGGSTTQCTLTLTPKLNQHGSSSITLSVSDGSTGGNNLGTQSFNFNVTAVNDSPDMTTIAPQTLSEDTTSSAIAFTISDPDSTVQCNAITVNSSNPTLLASSQVQISGGTTQNCSVVLSPSPDVSGTADITLSLSDGTSSKSQVFSVTVSEVNDPPTITVISNQTINEDTPTSALNFDIFDVESSINCTGVTKSSSDTAIIKESGIVVSGGTSSPGTAATCQVVITPELNQFGGSVTVTLTVGDGTVSVNQTFTISVVSVNDSPGVVTAGAVTYSINEDQANVSLELGSYTDVESAQNTLNYKIVTAPTLGTLGTLPSVAASGVASVTYTPSANANGSDTIVYKVCDGPSGTGACSPNVSIAIAMAAINDAPTLDPITDQLTSEDAAPISISLSASDPDSQLSCSGNHFSYTSSNQNLLAQQGGMSFSGTWPNCLASIQPVPDTFGVSNITVIASDGVLLASQTFALNVTAVNDAPQFSAITDQNMLEDAGSKVINFSLSDIDSSVTCASVNISSSQTSLIDSSQMSLAGGSTTQCTLTLTPKLNQHGSSSITLSVSDGSTGGNNLGTQSFNFNVTAVNDSPEMTTIASQTLSEDTTSSAIAFTISDPDSTVQCNAITVNSSNPTLLASSQVQISGGTTQNCSVVLSPSPDVSGTADITLSLSDGTSSKSQVFSVTVSEVNDPPTITVISNQTINEDTPTSALNFDIFDVESSINCTGVTKSSSDTAIIKESGIVVSGGTSSPGTAATCQVVITPELNQFGGSVTVTLTVGDGTVSVNQTFTISVVSVNDSPGVVTAGAVTYSINEDQANVSLELGSYTDVESAQNTLNYKIVTAPTLGTLGTLPSVAASGVASVTYTPSANANGSDTIVYKVCDGPSGTGACSPNVSIAIAMAAVNDAPVLATILDQSTDLDVPTSAFSVSITDVDGPSQTCSATYLTYTSGSPAIVASTGAVTWGGTWPNCTAVITPVSGASGSSLMSFSASDGTLVSQSKSFTLTINSNPIGWYQEAYLKALNAGANDLFGISVAIFGDTTVVGAESENSPARTIVNNGGWDAGNGDLIPSGAAYVFTRSGQNWTHQAYIKSSNSYIVHKFGASVASSADTAVVSAYGEGASSGSAYVYSRTANIWSQEAYIRGSNTSTGDYFGQKIALSNDTLIVGARNESSSQTSITNGSTASLDDSTSSSGAAYIFKRVSSNWNQEAYIKAANSTTALNFGVALAIHGDTAIVGAPSESSSQTTITNGTTAATDITNTSGAAYIYKRTGNTWIQQAYMKSSNSNASDNFGVSVALSGDIAVIGAKGEASNQTTVTNGTTASTDNSIGSAGASYIYKRTGNNWAQSAYIKAPNSNSLDYFGDSVALSGSTLVVGATGEASSQTTITNDGTASTNNSISQAGAVYIFKQNASLWAQEAYIKPSNAQQTDNFGNTVALSGDTVIVGALNEDSSQTTITNGTNSSADNLASSAGAVYVYRNRTRLFDPYNVSMSATSSSFTVNWMGTNLGSANGSFKVVYSTTTVGANCSSGTVAYTGTATSATVSASLTPGQTYNVRVCAFDGTNYSEGFVTQVTVKGDDVNPTILSIRRGSTANPVPQGATSMDFVVTFSETVVGPNNDNFQVAEVNTTSGASGKVLSTSCSAATCTILVSPLNHGELTLNLINSTGIVDRWGNPLTSTRTGDESYTLVNGWYQEAYLKASNTGANDYFGSVDLSSNLAIVGAYGESSNQTTITNDSTASADNSASAAGAGYVFQRNGALWSQQAYLKAPNANADDQFGHSVAISGNTAIVGALYEDSSQTTITNGLTASADNSISGAGAAYIFTYSGSAWSQQAYIKASNANNTDEFGGHSIGLSGNTAVVGARLEDSSQTTITNGTTSSTDNSYLASGAAYVYSRVGNDWSQQAYIKASNAKASNWFGDAISISGDTLVVGAYGESTSQVTITNGTTSGDNSYPFPSFGAAYVYQRTGSTWSQEAFIKASNAGYSDVFADSVSISGSTIAVGAPGEDSSQTIITNGISSSTNNTKSGSGAAYIYKRSINAWAQEAYIKASNTDSSDFFGGSLDLSGNTLIVEVVGEDSSQTAISNHSGSSTDNLKQNSGARFIYRRSGSTWTQEAYIKASNADASDGDVPNLGDPYLGLVAVSGDTTLVGVLNEDSSQTTVTNGFTASADNSASKSGAVYVYRNTTQIFDPDLYVSGKTTTSITLSWGANLGKANRVKIAPAATGSNNPASCTDPSSVTLASGVTSYTYSGLSTASKYSFRVCGFDGTNASEGSIIRESTD